jgi:hypothetical protein
MSNQVFNFIFIFEFFILFNKLNKFYILFFLIRNKDYQLISKTKKQKFRSKIYLMRLILFKTCILQSITDKTKYKIF